LAFRVPGAEGKDKIRTGPDGGVDKIHCRSPGWFGGRAKDIRAAMDDRVVELLEVHHNHTCPAGELTLAGLSPRVKGRPPGGRMVFTVKPESQRSKPFALRSGALARMGLICGS
jgi:hypothetical protein